jgi:hypothetical protein
MIRTRKRTVKMVVWSLVFGLRLLAFGFRSLMFVMDSN